MCVQLICLKSICSNLWDQLVLYYLHTAPVGMSDILYRILDHFSVEDLCNFEIVIGSHFRR